MNQNTSGAVLLLIIAAAGLHTNHPVAWFLAGLTAGLAFISNELRTVFELHTNPAMGVAALVVAVASWITTLAAVAALFI